MSLGAIFVLILFALFSLIALIAPWLGFVGYSSFAVLAPHWVWRDSLSGFEFQKYLSIATCIGFLITGLRKQRLGGALSFSLICYSFYVLLVLMGSGIQINPEKTSRFVDVTWKIWLMVILGVFLVDSERKIIIYVACLLVCGAWNALEVNLLYYRQGFVRVEEFYFAGFDNNLYSIASLPIACIALAGFLVSESRIFWAFCGLCLVLQMHQLMILQSRGTMVGALVSLCFAVFFMPKNYRTLTVVGCTVLVGGVLAGPSVIAEFMSSFKETEALDSSALSRLELWKAGAKIMLDYPIFGVGPWCGEIYVPQYYVGYAEARNYKALHNLFFEVGTGMGIPGVAMYLVFFFVPWYANLKAWKSGLHVFSPGCRIGNLAVLCGVPGYWCASMFSSGALIESPYLMVVLAIVTFAVYSNNITGEYVESDSDRKASV